MPVNHFKRPQIELHRTLAQFSHHQRFIEPLKSLLAAQTKKNYGSMEKNNRKTTPYLGKEEANYQLSYLNTRMENT